MTEEELKKVSFSVEEIRDFLSQNFGMYCRTVMGNVINVQKEFDKLVEDKINTLKDKHE